LLYTVPGVPRFGTIKTGEPHGSSPGNILANQIRTLVPPVSQRSNFSAEGTYSIAVSNFRPVLRSDILRGNNPSQLSPDDNLPHQRISLACTTCIAQAFCSREIFYHIFVYLASVFCRKLRFFFFIFSVLSIAAFSVQDAQSQRFLPVENSPASPLQHQYGREGRGLYL